MKLARNVSVVYVWPVAELWDRDIITLNAGSIAIFLDEKQTLNLNFECTKILTQHGIMWTWEDECASKWADE